MPSKIPKTRLYVIWQGIKQRCTNPNASGYLNYGGKGIKRCPEWDNFKVFENWAVNSGYADNLQIDRIDSNRDYYPENCRWVTKGFNTARRNIENGHLTKSRFTQKDVDEIILMRSKGATYKAIAKVFNCSISQASRLCNNEIKNIQGRD